MLNKYQTKCGISNGINAGINPETQSKQPLLQYMRTFSIHTSRSHACTPSTAVKIHPGNSQPPMKPHVNHRTIPRLLHFNLSINNYRTPPINGQLFCYSFVFFLQLIVIPLSKVYYILKPINITMYLPCVWNTGFFSFLNYFLFVLRERGKKRRRWQLANYFFFLPADL